MKHIYIFILVVLLFALAGKMWGQCNPDTRDCSITVHGWDGYGYGWDAARLLIYQDTEFVGTFTVNAAEFEQTYPVCSGEVTLVWESGSHDSFCSFSITDSLGVELFSCSSASGLSDTIAVVRACPTCMPVQGLGFVADSNSAIVSWHPNSNAVGFYYQYTLRNTPSNEWFYTMDTAVYLTGLNAYTVYHFFVYANCGVDDSSVVAHTVLRTTCGTMALPFTEDFENDGNMPECWREWEYAEMNDYYYIHYPQIYAMSNSGYYSLYMSTDYGPVSVMSPMVTIPANEVEVVLWAYGTGGQLQVGYTETNDSASAVFHPVDTITPDGNFTRYIISFANASPVDSIYVVLRAENNMMYSLVMIDDITIRQHRDCPLVDDMHVVATGPGSLTFEWSDTVSTSWEIAYGSVGFDPEYEGSIATVITNPGTLTGLDDHILYDFYVRAVCDSVRGYWSLPLTAQPNVYSMPQWGTDTLYTCGTSVVGPGGVTGQIEYGTYSTIVLMPNDSSSTIRVSGTVGLYSAVMEVYEGIGTDGRLLGSWTGSGIVEALSSVGPLTIVLDATMSQAEGIVLYTQCLPLPNCTDVYNVSLSDVRATTAMVTWQYATATPPAAFILTIMDTAGNDIESFTAGDTVRSMSLFGMEEHTNYMLGIQVVCASGDSSAVVWTEFMTPCLTGGEIAIGNESSTSTSSYSPYYPYSPYSMSQIIIDSTDLEGIDTVYGIRFNKLGGDNCVRNIDIYMDTTRRDVFLSSDDIIAQNMSNRYFTGEYASVNGWNEIIFSTPFVYNGSGNIVVTFDDNTGQFEYVIFQTQCHYTSGNKSLYANYSSDLNPCDISSFIDIPYYYMGVENTRINMVLLTPCGDASCVPPSVSVARVDTGSVTLSWIAGYDETQWSVDIAPAGTSMWQNYETSTSDDTIIVTGLTPSTSYRFRVGSLCGDTAAYTMVTASTACAPVRVLPFVEDFNNFSGGEYDGAFEMCWNRYTNYPQYYGETYYPFIENYISMEENGSSMYFYVSPYSGYYSQLVLPEMGLPVDTLIISFYLTGTYTSYYNYKAVVGVMTDPTDPYTFEPVDTVLFTAGDYEWQLHEVDLASYSGNGRYIAFQSCPDDYFADGFYLDNIRIEYTNPCKKALQPQVSDIRSGSVALSFIDTNNVGNYTIFYGIVDSVEGALDSVNITSTSYVLGGLAPATTYYMWVRVNCGNVMSNIVAFPVFSTHCLAIQVDNENGYLYDFEEGIDPCMYHLQGPGGVAWESSGSYFNPTGAHSGGHIAQFVPSSYPVRAGLVLPAFDFSLLDNAAELSFWLAQVADQEAQDYLCISYRTSDTAEWILIDSITSEITLWTEQFVSLPNSAHQPNYQIALTGVFNGGRGVKIDDVSVHASPLCHRPSDLQVSSVTHNAATLSWSGNGSHYTIAYRQVGDWSWQNVMSITDSITITGLENLGNYEVRVKSYCDGNEQSVWSEILTFFTNACVVSTSFYNYSAFDYTPVASDNIPAALNYAYSYSEVIIDNDYLSGISDIIAFGFETNNTLAGGCFGDCQVYFGTTTDTSFTNFLFDSSFVKVYDGSLNYATTGWHYFRLDSTYVYDGYSNLVVVINRHGTTLNYAVDPQIVGHLNNSIKGMEMHTYYEALNPYMARLYPSYYMNYSSITPNYSFLTCASYCEGPDNLWVSVSDHSATLTWEGNGLPAQVSYKVVSDANWSEPIAVNDNIYHIGGLDHSTEYLFRVRIDCTEDSLGFSNWVTASATTEYVCTIPENVQVTEITNHSAQVSWTSNPGDNMWEIYITNSSGYGNIHLQVDSNPAYIDDLEPAQHYFLKVRTICGPSHSVEGDYSSIVEFNTPICGSVSHLHGSADSTTVKLGWTSGDNNIFWEILYGLPGFTYDEALGTIVSADTTYAIRNLLPNQTYGFHVRALCGLDWNSNWSSEELLITTGHTSGIESKSHAFEYIIYPNPTSQFVNIEVSGVNGQVTVSVLDINGTSIVSETIDCTINAINKVNVDNLNTGVYFVRIMGDNINCVRKLIVR